MTCPAPPRVLHGEMYSLRIFVLIFDAIDAFSFAVLKTPFLLSRIRSLTPLRLKESASDTSCDAMAGGSHTQQAQHPQRALPSKALRSSRQEPPPRDRRVPQGGRGHRHSSRESPPSPPPGELGRRAPSSPQIFERKQGGGSPPLAPPRQMAAASSAHRHGDGAPNGCGSAGCGGPASVRVGRGSGGERGCGVQREPAVPVLRG